MEDQNYSQENSVLTVTQLTGLVKTLLEKSFCQVQLKGEISNFKNHSSGHLYFSLKDNNAQIKAVMFRGKAMSLNFQPKDGMLVQVSGQITVYAQQGNYQIVVNSMKKAGVGDIMEMIEERKKKLAAEGLFDSSRKRPIPRFPMTVGVVTSSTGAALRDIINVTRQRNPKMNLTVFPAQVQGEGAAATIVKMIKTANRYKMCDVLIVGRGGGSLEDLLPFSDEEVVRTIAASEIPVISAVGHEIDWALSDYAADVRASTPSHAAEIAVPRLADITEQIVENRSQLYESIRNHLDTLKLLLKTFKPEGMIQTFRNIQQPYAQRFDYAREALVENMQSLVKEKRMEIQQHVTILENANPQTIFDRGYSMVTDAKTGKVIRNASQLKTGSQLLIKPSAGTIRAEVIDINS